MRRLIFLCLYLGLILQSRILAQDQFQPVRAKAEKLLIEHKIPAISIGVAQDGRLLWAQGFGFADREKKKRASAQTVYSIGSTSKPITATAIMMLVKQGKIDLDAPANTYLDKTALIRSPFNDVQNVTVRRLLNHTSGLSRHSQMFIGNELYLLPKTNDTIRRYGILTKPAGEVFEYSNLGFAILGQIVRQVSGETFGDFLSKNIFSPLGMNHSRLGQQGRRRLAEATAYSADQKPVTAILSDTPGAADIYSSVHDMLLFGIFCSDTRSSGQASIVPHALLDQMMSESSVRGISKYGLGWESLQIGKYKTVYHHGSNGYGTSIFVMLPEKKISISILSNITTPHIQSLAEDILKIMVPDYSENLDHFRSSSTPEPVQPYRPSDKYTGHWKGRIETWKEKVPVEMWFKSDGDIHIQLKGQYRYLLNGVRFEEQYLRGSFQGNTNTEDANRHRYNLHLKLRLRGANSLNGALTSSSYDPQGNVLTSWISLEKEP